MGQVIPTICSGIRKKHRDILYVDPQKKILKLITWLFIELYFVCFMVEIRVRKDFQFFF